MTVSKQQLAEQKTRVSTVLKVWLESRDRSLRDKAEPGSVGSAEGRQKHGTASMFSGNHRSWVTAARGSALEMQFKHSCCWLSLFCDPPEDTLAKNATP